MELEELNQIKYIISEELKKREVTKKVVYTHNCYGSSEYHFRKYKHWTKIIKQIDDSKKMVMHLWGLF